MAKNRKIYNPKMVRVGLEDPSGFTPENNPNPYPLLDCIPESPTKRHYDYMEYYPDGSVYKCHKCLLRAKYGSGNCQDNGEYFICLPKDVREGKVKIKLKKLEPKKKSVQSTLI